MEPSSGSSAGPGFIPFLWFKARRSASATAALLRHTSSCAAPGMAKGRWYQWLITLDQTSCLVQTPPSATIVKGLLCQSPIEFFTLARNALKPNQPRLPPCPFPVALC
jgi:hypothetical protein